MLKSIEITVNRICTPAGCSCSGQYDLYITEHDDESSDFYDLTLDDLRTLRDSIAAFLRVEEAQATEGGAS